MSEEDIIRRPVKSLLVTTLADNMAFTEGLLGQWGFSALLELFYEGGKRSQIMFDTSAVKDGFLYNINKMKVNLSDLDGIVISHGHRDHTGSTVEVLERSARKVPVVVHPYAFRQRFRSDKSGKKHFSGIPKGERAKEITAAGGQLVCTTTPYQISGVSTTGEVPRKTTFEKTDSNRRILIQGRLVKDELLDDQSVLVNVKRQGIWVITGCAHSGIINILRHVERLFSSERICGVIGGLHFVDKKDKQIAVILDALKTFDLNFISPCHCTGFRAMTMMSASKNPSFILNFTGRKIHSRTYRKLTCF